LERITDQRDVAFSLFPSFHQASLLELTYSSWFLPCSELGGLLSEFELAATEGSIQRKKNGIGFLADHLESGRTNAHRQSIVEVLYRFGFPF